MAAINSAVIVGRAIVSDVTDSSERANLNLDANTGSFAFLSNGRITIGSAATETIPFGLITDAQLVVIKARKNSDQSRVSVTINLTTSAGNLDIITSDLYLATNENEDLTGITVTAQAFSTDVEFIVGGD